MPPSPRQPVAPIHGPDGSLTAADFLETQLALEKQAREAMPYEPDMCTYPQALRQLVFACLTCRKENGNLPLGVCYLCLIQCHSTHELVELFAKRDFVCDCGTSRMGAGSACAVRTRQARKNSAENHSTVPRMRSGSVSGPELGPLSLAHPFSAPPIAPATDIEALCNTYNQNYAGRFCSCEVQYNPVHETQTMHQCYLGDACGEDWYHQECILGYKPGLFHKPGFIGTGENKLDDLAPPGVDAALESAMKTALDNVENASSDEPVPHFPLLDVFGEYVCWKCVAKHQDAFAELCAAHPDIVVATRRHFSNISSPEEWALLNETHNQKFLELLTALDVGPPAKRQKLEMGRQLLVEQPYSVFLAENSHLRFAQLQQTLAPSSPIFSLLKTFDFLLTEDPVYQPVEDDVMSTQASEGSLYDLGSSALLSLPIPQALEGLQAYDTMKEKLKGFFKDFVDQKKVVTEEEVRGFFSKMKDE